MPSFEQLIYGDQIPELKGEAVLGFRKWRVDKDNNLLLSATNNIPWQPGSNIATGCSGHHASPGDDCHCGFNAWYDFDKNQESSYPGVSGAFAGAGKVQLHRDGFRSEKAQIIALYVEDNKTKRSLRGISQNYGIPIFTEADKFLEFVQRYAKDILTLKEEISALDNVTISGVIKSIKTSGSKNILISLAYFIPLTLVSFFFTSVILSTLIDTQKIKWLTLGEIVMTVFFVLLLAMLGSYISLKIRDNKNASLGRTMFKVLIVFCVVSVIPAYAGYDNQLSGFQKAETEIQTADNLFMAIGIMQNDYHREHEVFADNPNLLTTEKEFKKTGNKWQSISYPEIPPFEMKTGAHNQTYMFLSQIIFSGKETILAKSGGYYGLAGHSISSECKGDLCDLILTGDRYPSSYDPNKQKEAILGFYQSMSNGAVGVTSETDKVKEEMGFSEHKFTRCYVNEEIPFYASSGFIYDGLDIEYSVNVECN